MPPTLETRKPVVKLTATDFRAFPIWEYAIDEEGRPGQDETWVRPVNGKAVRNGVYSQIVAADFETPMGRTLPGFMIVTTVDRRIEIHPGAIVGRTGYRSLPTLSQKMAVHRKLDWLLRERDALLHALREPENRVFPFRYALRVPIHGEMEVRQGVVK